MCPGFRYRHWPGFSGRTHPSGLAATYVFSKQSGPPCHCDLRSQLFARTAGTPSPEVTGPICRVPSPPVSRHALGYSPRPPVSVLGTVSSPQPNISFSVPQSQANSPKASHSSLAWVHVITTLPHARRVRQGDGPARPIWRRKCLAWPCGQGWRHRNINRFPFRLYPSRDEP